MTREEARKAAEIMLAYADGKTVQCISKTSNDIWDDSRSPVFNFDNFDYRIKPEIKYRPWKSDEVPLGAIIKSKLDHHSRTIIFSVSSNGIDLPYTNTGTLICLSFESALKGCEHSLNNGKTWLPCGVVIE